MADAVRPFPPSSTVSRHVSVFFILSRYMLLAGPTFPTDLSGGNVYEADFPMEAQDLDTIVGGSGERCCGENSQVAASHSHVFWDRVLGEAVRNNNLNALVIDTLQVWATGFTSRINNTDAHELWLGMPVWTICVINPARVQMAI